MRLNKKNINRSGEVSAADDKKITVKGSYETLRRSREDFSYEKLPPLKSKYLTSDSIRTHSRLRAKQTTQPPAAWGERSGAGQGAGQGAEKLAVEPRTNFQSYNKAEEVLLGSGYHNSLSVQSPGPGAGAGAGPSYDFTIGDTRAAAAVGHQDPILNHQFFPTVTPVQRTGGRVSLAASGFPAAGAGAGAGYYATPTSPPHPGLYFPPTGSSESRNPLNNYDFTIGGATSPASNPVLAFLSKQGQGEAVRPVPVAAPVQPVAAAVTPSTAAPGQLGRSHTTARIPASGRRFPHFPSREVTDREAQHTARSLRSRPHQASPQILIEDTVLYWAVGHNNLISIFIVDWYRRCSAAAAAGGRPGPATAAARGPTSSGQTSLLHPVTGVMTDAATRADLGFLHC